MLKRLLRRWKLIGCLGLCLAGAALAIGYWQASRMLQPARLVKTLEAKFNARIEIADVASSLLSSPASVTIKNFSLVPRDEAADAGMPLDQRAKLAGIKQTGFGAALTEVKLNPWAALRGKIHITEASMDFIRLNTEQSEAGVDMLSELLAKPRTVNGKPRQPEPGEGEAQAAAQAAAPGSPREIQIDKLSIDRLRLDSRSLKRRQTISLQDMHLGLSGAHFIGNSLAPGSTPAAELAGKFLLLGKRKVEQLNLNLEAKTGAGTLDGSGILAQLPFSVLIKKDSRINELPALQRINEKIKKWEDYGLRLEPLPESAVVLEDSPADFIYAPGKLTTASDFTLKLDNYEVVLKRGGELLLEDDACRMEIVLRGTESASRAIIAKFREGLQSKLSQGLGGTMHDKIVEVFKKESLLLPDGRLSIPMGLTGPLGKPKVEDRVTDILKDALKDALLSGITGS